MGKGLLQLLLPVSSVKKTQGLAETPVEISSPKPGRPPRRLLGHRCWLTGMLPLADCALSNQSTKALEELCQPAAL